MTAITERLLHLRPVRRAYTFSLRSFSSSSDTGNPPDVPQSKPESEPQTRPSVSSYLNDVKASLQKESPPLNRPRFPRPSFSGDIHPQKTPPPKISNLDEIRRNLSEFRSRSAPSPPSRPSGESVTFRELYERNLSNDSAPNSNSAAKPTKGPSFDAIKESFRHLRENPPAGKASDPLSLSRFKETLNLKPGQKADGGDSPTIIGGSSRLPSFLGKEKNRGGDGNLGSSGAMRTRFLKNYKHSELGKELKMLRPDKKSGKWFSLNELNERLVKLRKMEEEAVSDLGIGGSMYIELRESLGKLSEDDKEKRKNKVQRINVLSQLGGTPSFMMNPPKDHLVEKYFHPDNMSSAEKLKLELKKVRDEFKMNESDCGSARVQVAQLTTKIKHLSTVLAKKDKHSRRGLQAMVQRRKKLLKYLRRTDWDSYSLCLSKLELRDNPDIKA